MDDHCPPWLLLVVPQAPFALAPLLQISNCSTLLPDPSSCGGSSATVAPLSSSQPNERLRRLSQQYSDTLRVYRKGV